MPFSLSTARIVAFGMAAPDESITVPVIPPEEPTPCAYAAPVANNKQSESHVPLIGFISPPSVFANFRAGSNLWPEYSLLGTPEASGRRTPAEPGRRRPCISDLITICGILLITHHASIAVKVCD